MLLSVFLFSVQSHKVVLSLPSHSLGLCLRLPPSPYLPFILFFDACFSFSFTLPSEWQQGKKRGLSARLPLVFALQLHANHGGGKMMVGGKKKSDFDLILRLAAAALLWVIVPQGQIWLPLFSFRSSSSQSTVYLFNVEGVSTCFFCRSWGFLLWSHWLYVILLYVHSFKFGLYFKNSLFTPKFKKKVLQDWSRFLVWIEGQKQTVALAAIKTYFLFQQKCETFTLKVKICWMLNPNILNNLSYCHCHRERELPRKKVYFLVCHLKGIFNSIVYILSIQIYLVCTKSEVVSLKFTFYFTHIHIFFKLSNLEVFS